MIGASEVRALAGACKRGGHRLTGHIEMSNHFINLHYLVVFDCSRI